MLCDPLWISNNFPFVCAYDAANPWAEWISDDGIDVTDAFIRYATPLIGTDCVGVPVIGGRLRLAQLEPIFADQKLPKYVPQANRDE